MIGRPTEHTWHCALILARFSLGLYHSHYLGSTDNSVSVNVLNHRVLDVVIISRCDGLPSLVDELNEGQAGVLLNGVLPLLSVEDTATLIW